MTIWGTQYNNLLKRGVRISLRSKVNDALVSGLRIVDSMLAIGRGQRQLILGDRYTGKTSIYISLLLKLNVVNCIGSLDGLGSRRIFGLYVGINQNLSKLCKLIHIFGVVNWYSLILATHSSSSALLSFMLPMIAISISERLRDRGYDICICFDDLSKHSKAYRQCSLLLNKIPSRDAYPADIFNIHSSLLERCGKLKLNYFGGSITSLPIIETVNADITEYIATNVISITDGQFYTNRNLFLNSNRPAIDSGLSVSRIGSNAQCKLMKIISLGIKNELTNLRLIDLASDSVDFLRLQSLNVMFYQDYLLLSSLEISMVLLLAYRNGMFFNNSAAVHWLLLILAVDYLYLIYLLLILKCSYTFHSYTFITYITLTIISYHLTVLVHAFLWSMLLYSSSNSISINSIYGVHRSNHSSSLAVNLGNIVVLFWLSLSLSFNLPLFIIMLLFWLSIFNWLNDLYIESFLWITCREQLSLIYSIKLLIISELMLFLACFCSLVNFRFIGSPFSIFSSFPLLACYSFSIPFSNLCILLFSSLPLQSAQIFIKIGFLDVTIESLAQSFACGLLSIILQFKEFLYSFFTISDCLTGSIFYFSTGLHGLHVVIGTFLFFMSLSMAYPSLYFMEYSFPLFLSSYYWHFVDWIWFCVFLLIVLYHVLHLTVHALLILLDGLISFIPYILYCNPMLYSS